MSERKKNHRSTRRWVWAGAIIIGIAMLLFAGLFFFNSWMQRKLERMVHKQTNGIYTLSLIDFQASPFTGALSIDSVLLKPNYKQWQQLEQQDKKAPAMLFAINSGPLKLRGLNYFRMLFGQGVGMDLLELEHPDLQFVRMKQGTAKQAEPLYKNLQGMLRGLRIDEIDVNNGSLRFQEKPDASSPIAEVQHFNLSVLDYQLDSAAYVSKDRAYYAKKSELQIKGLRLEPTSGFSLVTVDSVYMNTEKGTFMATDLHMEPKGSPAELARKKGDATSYTKVDAARLQLSGVNYEAHSRTDQFIVQKAVLASPKLNSFKDKKNFTEEDTKSLPHQMVQQMEQKFLVDTVQVNNGYVRYSELVPKGTERGYITFEDINISITNFTNMPGRISHKNPAVVHAKAMVMGKAPMSMTVRMPLLDKNGYHTITGDVGETNPAILNPMLAPTTFVSVESGHISSGHFDFTLNNDKADGTLTVLYSNFEIELLSKGKGKRQGLGKEILSEIVNWVAIKSSNPDDKGEKPRVGQVSVTRNKTHSVFSYWKDCLVSGILSSMGLESRAKK